MSHPRSPNLLMSFRYAGEGVLYTIRTQRNFRVHMAMAGVITALGLWLKLPPHSWAVLALTIGIVLVTEIVNTAAETLVDLASPNYHPLAKQVKDLAAGAVLVIALAAVIVGLLILGPPLLAKVGLLQ